MKKAAVLTLALFMAVPLLAADLRPLGGKLTGTKSYVISDGASFGGCIVTSDGNAATVKVVDSAGQTILDFSTTASGMFNAPITSGKTITCTVSGTNAYAQFFEWVK
jgi:hypothetical protein